ncbi:universal stress protein [Kushneria aurantia]|uniref:Universal stress protein n=1 Tax=Kushneria aurantia TaxID=504092 RepID=A0ABV6G2N7_9GAMM|nr:universal stress protein [Kushneria aurantia]
MTSTLLLATDLSGECHAALVRALHLTQHDAVQLDILYVVDPWLPESILPQLVHAVRDSIDQQLEQACHHHELERPETEIHVVSGVPYAEIIREAYERSASMILMGTHRKLGQPDLIGGTTLSRVMRRAPCPVVSVPHDGEPDWQDVLVPVDFSLASRHTLKEVLTRFPHVRLTLLHAWDMPVAQELAEGTDYRRWRDGERQRLRQQLERETERLMSELGAHPDLELVLQQGDPGEVLLSRLRQQPPDLLALGSHIRVGIGRTTESLLERLLSDVRGDLMLCRTW